MPVEQEPPTSSGLGKIAAVPLATCRMRDDRRCVWTLKFAAMESGRFVRSPDLGAGRSKGPEEAHSEHARNRACSFFQSDPNEPPVFFIALTLNLFPPRLALRQARMV
jgi:hypothetical protein